MHYLFYFLIFCSVSCQISNKTTSSRDANPPAKGFDLSGSDSKAQQIADQVMEAMGGRRAWDDTRVLAWNFGGRRFLIWDKKTGDVRIDIPGDTTVYLLNIFNKNIQALVRGKELVHADSLTKHYSKAEGIWINDSYWLVMPFKLKDSGVTLTYVGEDVTQVGVKSDVLQLTFKNVGNTPDNMYRVWVDQSDQLIKQWAFYARYDQEKAPAIWPWDNYRQFGNIKLSSDRSDERGPKFVQVPVKVPHSVFTDFAPVPSLVRF